MNKRQRKKRDKRQLGARLIILLVRPLAGDLRPGTRAATPDAAEILLRLQTPMPLHE